MKTTIIDLLNKIANDEEVPKKILFDNKVYKWNDGVDYENEDKGWTEFLLSEKCICKDFLNDEVEILETAITYKQDKIENNKQDKIEKLDYCKIVGDGTLYQLIQSVNVLNKDFTDKINELINYIQKEN